MEITTIKSEKTYKILSVNNHSFSVALQNLGSSISISSSFQDDVIKNIYKSDYDLDSLKKINKYFLIYESINEIYDDLILFFDKNKTKIIEEANLIKISIPIESIKIKEIVFTLKKSEKNDNEKLQELISVISELKVEIKKLKEENKIIKEENKKLTDKLEAYIPYLEKYKKKCDDKNKKIHNLESLIINDNEKYNTTLKNWINPNLPIKAKLLYRLTRDGEEYETFHKLCDYKGPTIVLTKLTDGNILGLYCPLDWETKTNDWKSDPNIFVFSLTENKKAMKKKTDYNFGIYCHSSYGPDSYFLCFTSGHKMNEPRIRFGYQEYIIDTQTLVPGKKDNEFCKACEVEVFKIIIG